MTEPTGDERIDSTHDHLVTLLRVPPTVTFGLRSAALAGAAVPAKAVAIGLAGVFDDGTTLTTYTTCSENATGLV